MNLIKIEQFVDEKFKKHLTLKNSKKFYLIY